MENKKEEKKNSNFKIVKKLPAFSIDSNTYYISNQIITSDQGNESEHVVIKKQGFNEDGSPRGVSKQLFIPVTQAEKVLTAVLNYLKQK